jgi:hypothetical protein
MTDFSVKVYHAVVKMEDGEEYAVDLGVVDKGVPFEAYWDSWIDQRIYFNLTAQELEDLKAGDELSEGDIVMEIDKVNPSIWEAVYDPDRYPAEEGAF